MDFQKIIKPTIWENRPYKIADRTGLIKLDSMEMPFDWDQQFKKDIFQFENVEPNRYPDSPTKVSQHIHQYLHLSENTGVLCGNGSDEIIQLLMLMIQSQKSILTLNPTFSMYQIIAQYVGLSIIEVDLTNQFEIDMAKLLADLKKECPAILLIATPNNPTGQAFKESDLKNLIENAPNTLVILDEAYQPFCSHINHLPWLDQYPNLAIIRTFSKIGFASLRFGFLLAQQGLIEQLEKIRLPYNLNSYTQQAILNLLKQPAVIDQAIQKLFNAKMKLLRSLKAFEFIHTYPSDANFFLLRIEPPFSANALYTTLKNNGILIKLLHGTHPLLENTIRITVGTPTENKQLIQQLAKFFSCKPTH